MAPQRSPPCARKNRLDSEALARRRRIYAASRLSSGSAIRKCTCCLATTRL